MNDPANTLKPAKTAMLIAGLHFDKFDIEAILKLRAAGYDVDILFFNEADDGFDLICVTARMEVMDTTPEGCTDPDVWWRQLTDFSDWMHAFMEPYGSLYQSDCFKNPTPKQRLYKSFDHPVPGEAP